MESVSFVAVVCKTPETFLLTLRTWQLPLEIYPTHTSLHQFIITEHAGMQDIDNILCEKLEIYLAVYGLFEKPIHLQMEGTWASHLHSC